MTRSFPTSMDEARRLIAANRLSDATTLIQATLARAGGAPAASSPHPFDGPTIELDAARREVPSRPAPAASLSRGRPRFPPAGALRPGSPGPALKVPDGARFLRLRYEGPHGGRNYRLYVPSGQAVEPRPLVVMLHGCTQNPEDFALGTRMNRLAEERNLLVAYPEQVRSANASLCWNWFEPAHQRHGAGEPAILAGIVAEIAASHSLDRTRVFAAGLSAGGAMAAVLGATYGDVFAAVGVHSGLPYGSASDVASALGVMRSGRAKGRDAARTVRTIVFHGARDTTVHPANGERLAGLRPDEAGCVTTSGTANGRAYTRIVAPQAQEVPSGEHWRIEGLAHAWSGGDAGGSYADPAGPDASREMLRFFLDEGREAGRGRRAD